MASEHISHRSPAGCGARRLLVIRVRTSYGVVIPARPLTRPAPRWTARRRAAAAGWDRGVARLGLLGHLAVPRRAPRRNARDSGDIARLARRSWPVGAA